MDKNKNGIPDYIEAYILLIVSFILIVFALSGVCLEWISEPFAYKLTILGVIGLAGDEVIKKYFFGK